ncbi:MAG TPA: DNA recombination protein RmuC [Opitutaceae bacterium]|nr:DNA recombination protein RmuC [Opitutaceae bacterium]
MTTLVAFVAAVLGGLIVWLWLGRKSATLAERARAADEQLRKAQLDLAALRAECDTVKTQATRLETALSAEREALQKAEIKFADTFKALSSEALKSSNESFLALAQTTLEKFQEGAKGDLERRQEAINSLVKPLRDSLEKVDTKISEIEKARASAYGQLGQQLESLQTAQLRLQAEAGKLSTALRSTSYAGSWGELQLRRVVEMADMLPYCDFVEQQTAGALRADLVVRLPGGQRIVVDAKAPLESYRAALEVTDENVRAEKSAEHAAKVRGHIDALGAKNYWEQFQPAPEFVVLFLPGDHFLTAALQADSSLMERAIARRVLLATPTTLIALLKAAAYGWRQEAVSKNAEEISRLGRDLYDRAATFAEHLDKVGRGLETAVKGYNSAVGSFEQALLPGARRFAELGAKGTKDLPGPGSVETAPRDVVRRS